MIASPEMTDDLIKEYGARVVAVKGFACQHNAIKAALAIYSDPRETVFPRIWEASLPDGDKHTYLVKGNTVYNQKITWPDGTYPDLDLEQLAVKGKDVTLLVLGHTSMELECKPGVENLGFADFLETALSTPKKRVAKFVRLAIANLMMAGAEV